MDFERIKRNLRFRSGRSKKSQKQTAATQNGGQKEQTQRNGVQNQQPVQNGAAKKGPTQPPTREYSFTRKKSDPSLRVWDQSTALPRIESDRNLPAQAKGPSNPSIYQTAPQNNTDTANTGTGSERVDSTAMNQQQRRLVPQRSQTQVGGMQSKAHRPQAQRNATDIGPQAQSSDDTDDFDLKPPTRSKKPTSLDVLSESLFGGGHLDTILQDAQFFVRFTAFLNRYRPQAAPVLIRYLETQKAVKAVEYANAVAESVAPLPSDSESEKKHTAAQLDTAFEAMRKKAFEDLLSQALPAYVTYSLIKVSTEIMVNEITGRSTPVMKGLVSGLTEVFCLTDPNQEDNPIIYASEEFYNMTGYARDFVIGTNCRFLQGPKTKRHSVHRLRQAIDSGQEHSEALLNYRRDGRPFMNLLMIAPLHDNKGNVKYHIGAQIDVSGLVEGGKGLDAFERYLANEQILKSRGPRSRQSNQKLDRSQDSINSKEAKKNALNKLGELSDMFDLEESAVVAQRSRSISRGRRSEDEESTSSVKARRRFGESSDSESEEDGDDEKEKAAWALSQSGSSGKLPGVYQSYLLMRPSPSMKIIFTSPGLKKLGNIVQSPFMSHVTAPLKTLKGLKESFESGNPVTAKVIFSPETSRPDGNKALDRGQSRENLEDAPARAGRTCWISATPLLGDDDQVGVWVVVIVDQRSLSSAMSPARSNSKSQRTPSRKSTVRQQPDSTPKTPTSNSTPASGSRAGRPMHITMPERMNSQQGGRQGDVADGPSTRKPSMMPARTKSGRDIMVRRDEPLYRNQSQQGPQQPQRQRQRQTSALSTPRPNKNAEEDADEYVRKYDPSDMPPQKERVDIKPDAEDEADEAGKDPFALSSEANEQIGIANISESAPVREADTLSTKESNMMARAEPEKVAEDNSASAAEQDRKSEETPERAETTEHTQEAMPDVKASSAEESTAVQLEEPATASDEEHTLRPAEESEIGLGESARSPPVEPTAARDLSHKRGPEDKPETALGDPAISPPGKHTQSHSDHPEMAAADDGTSRSEAEPTQEFAESAKPPPEEPTMPPSRPEDESTSGLDKFTSLSPEEPNIPPTDESHSSPEADAEPTADAKSGSEEGEYVPVRQPSIKDDDEVNEMTDHSEHLQLAARKEAEPSVEEAAEPSAEKQEEPAQQQEEDTSSHKTPTRPKGYMDYLRHPGSRPVSHHGNSSGGGSGMAGMNLSTGTSLGELQRLGHDEDPDCARTPFSVD